MDFATYYLITVGIICVAFIIGEIILYLVNANRLIKEVNNRIKYFDLSKFQKDNNIDINDNLFLRKQYELSEKYISKDIIREKLGDIDVQYALIKEHGLDEEDITTAKAQYMAMKELLEKLLDM